MIFEKLPMIFEKLPMIYFFQKIFFNDKKEM